MKITNVKEGTRIFNKVNGREYEVTSVPEGASASSFGILAVAVNPETNEIYDSVDMDRDTVVLTEKNAICFKTLFIPKDTTVPVGYTVSDGILCRNDAQVTEQGQIVVESIIHALPGYLVLAVKPKTDEAGMIDLFTYNVERDRFQKLIRSSSIPMPKVVLEKENSVVLGYNKTYMEDVLDENGEKTGEEKEVFDGASLILVHDERADSVRFDNPVNLGLIPVAGSQGMYLIESKAAGTDEAEEINPAYYEIFVKEEYISMELLAYNLNARIVSASAVTLYDRGLFLKGEDFILYNDLRIDSPLVKQMPGKYLVDITYGEHEVTVTLVDEDYNTSSIVRKNTKDRGYIVSLV